jgi:hypothetical protein
MFSKSKSDTVTSTVGGAPKKGNSGKLELYAESTGNNTFNLVFQDVGNYGRLRYRAALSTVNAEEIRTMALSLLDLVDGHVSDTKNDSYTSSLALVTAQEDNMTSAQSFTES